MDTVPIRSGDDVYHLRFTTRAVLQAEFALRKSAAEIRIDLGRYAQAISEFSATLPRDEDGNVIIEDISQVLEFRSSVAKIAPSLDVIVTLLECGLNAKHKNITRDECLDLIDGVPGDSIELQEQYVIGRVTAAFLSRSRSAIDTDITVEEIVDEMTARRTEAKAKEETEEISQPEMEAASLSTTS